MRILINPKYSIFELTAGMIFCMLHFFRKHLQHLMRLKVISRLKFCANAKASQQQKLMFLPSIMLMCQKMPLTLSSRTTSSNAPKIHYVNSTSRIVSNVSTQILPMHLHLGRVYCCAFQVKSFQTTQDSGELHANLQQEVNAPSNKDKCATEVTQACCIGNCRD